MWTCPLACLPVLQHHHRLRAVHRPPHHLRDRPDKGLLLVRHATRAGRAHRGAGLALHGPLMESQGLAPCTDALACHPLSLRMPMRWPISGLSVLHGPPAQGADDGPAGY